MATSKTHFEQLLSKIKPHSDAVNYFKEFPFIINPSKNQS